MGAPLFTFSMKKQAMASTLYFLNEGEDDGGVSLHFLNGSTLHFLNEDKCEMFCSSLSPSKNGRVKNGVPYRPILL